MATEKHLHDLKTQIVENAREIEELSRLPLPPQDFFRQFLRRTISAVGARSGAVWLREANGRLQKLAELGIPGAEADAGQNGALISQAVQSGESRCLPAGHEDNPFGETLYLAPLHSGDDCAGIVQLRARQDVAPNNRQGQLQYLEQMAGFASQFLQQASVPTNGAAVTDAFWKKLADFTLELQSSLDFKTVAFTAVNDGRMLLGCDRVSVAQKRGRKTVIVAISGQDQVNRRANLVRSMSRLAAQVIPTGETTLFKGTSKHIPPQVEQPLAEFVAESGSRTVMIVPLRATPAAPAPGEEEPASRNRRPGEKPWGAAIFEWVENAPLNQTKEGGPQPERQAIALTDHVAAALVNARHHQRIFLLPLWKALGRSGEWLYGRKVWKTLIALSAVAGVLAALLLVRWEYRVEGDGRLMPEIQREVYAPDTGQVYDVAVTDGQRVQQGSVLLKIQNHDLNLELRVVQSERAEMEQGQVGLAAQIDEAIENARQDDATRLRGEFSENAIRIEGLKKKEAALIDRQQVLVIRSPIDGIVTAFQLEQQLKTRPVQRGELLLEVMNDKGPWILELDVDEQRMGHVLEARERSPREKPIIDFVLATAPEQNHEGRLTRISSQPMLLPERGSVVRVIGSIDGEGFERRIGAEVRAKIHCGEKSLGYVLFGDVIEFVYQQLWL